MATTQTQNTVSVPTYGSTVVDTMGRTGTAMFNPNTGAPLASPNASGGTDRVNGISQNPNVPNADGSAYNATQAAAALNTQPVQPGQPINTSQPSPKPVNVTPATGSNTQSNVPGAITTVAQAKAAGAFDAQNGTGSYAQKYGAALANAQGSGQTAPQSPGAGSAGAQDHVAQTQTSPQPVYDTSKVDNAMSDVTTAAGQAHQKYIDDYTQSQTSQAQTESLTQTYSDLMNQLGIPALNTELMNMKNIMDGTEQDIRNEVTKAGGFATNSQVLAMTDARNKTMIQNYNNLLQTRDDATKNLTTMMDFTEKDRAYAQTKIDNQLNFDKQNIDYADKALTNAQNAYTTMQKSEGWDGIYKAALATGDPQAVDKINSTMGTGFDLATMAQQDAKTRAQTAQDTALKTEQLQATIANTRATTAKTQAETATAQGKALEDAGLPNPAKVGQAGYNDQGIKYNATNASQEIKDYWKNQQAFDPNTGKIPPAFYNNALASWVMNGLSASDFKDIFGGYKDLKLDSQKLYN